MNDLILGLANQIVSLHNQTPERILVCIAGVPGSGKSTLAYPLVDKINSLLGIPTSHLAEVDEDQMLASSKDETESEWNKKIAVAVGLDGWHLSRAELDKFDDPIEAHRIRGAPSTFNPSSYQTFLSTLTSNSSLPLAFPTFSHSIKDPTVSPYSILPTHRIIIIEGLYTLLNTTEWIQTGEKMDLKIYVECERLVARERLIRRHLIDGVEATEEAARDRVDGSDMINGEFIRNNMITPDVIIHSTQDSSLI